MTLGSTKMKSTGKEWKDKIGGMKGTLIEKLVYLNKVKYDHSITR